MQSRRSFIGRVASGVAGTIAVPAAVLGANDRVRMGIIGVGARGLELVRQAVSLPDVEFVAFADMYTKRLDSAKTLVPDAATYMDHRRMLEDKSIDAVIIATPQHLHCEHFVASLDAGKHVYQEKTMAFTVEHAKRMRAAYQKAAGKHSCRSATRRARRARCRTRQSFLETGTTGQDHRDPHAHVSQHAARKAAVVAAGAIRT